jgi:hypothetical protein
VVGYWAEVSKNEQHVAEKKTPWKLTKSGHIKTGDVREVSKATHVRLRFHHETKARG